MGGAASKPRSRESERRRGGGGRAGERSLFPLLSRSGARAAATHPPPNSDRGEQGPRAALPALRALDRTRGRLGSPRAVRAGAWEEEEAEDGLPGAPPAPAASHLPSAPPSPQLRPMGSFIPSRALYKYLPSAHRVPSAGSGAAGMRREEPEPAGPPLPGLAVRTGKEAAVEETGGMREGARTREGFPKEVPPAAPLVALPLPFTPATLTPLVPLQLVARLSLHLQFPLPRILSPPWTPPP